MRLLLVVVFCLLCVVVVCWCAWFVVLVVAGCLLFVTCVGDRCSLVLVCLFMVVINCLLRVVWLLLLVHIRCWSCVLYVVGCWCVLFVAW